MSMSLWQTLCALHAADRAAQDPFIVARLEELFDDDIFSYAGMTALHVRVHEASRCVPCMQGSAGQNAICLLVFMQKPLDSGAAAQCQQPP